jgi:hypothetical protein
MPSPEVLLVNGDKMECSCCKMVLTSLEDSTNLLGGTLRHDDETIDSEVIEFETIKKNIKMKVGKRAMRIFVWWVMMSFQFNFNFLYLLVIDPSYRTGRVVTLRVILFLITNF